MRKVKKRGVIKAKIKRGDEVVFISGKEYNRYQKMDDGKVARVPYRGKVIAVDPSIGKVKVDGAMIVKKHQKPNPQLEQKGGIVKREAWVDISNISLIDPQTDKPTRVKIEVREGEKVRVAKSGEVIPNPNPFARVEKAEEEAVEATEEAVEETEVSAGEAKADEKSKEKSEDKSEDNSEDKSEDK